MEYRAVSVTSAGALQTEVDLLIAEGWVPQGGVAAEDGRLTHAMFWSVVHAGQRRGFKRALENAGATAEIRSLG